MSGSHPVASGSIPGIGFLLFLVLLAQLAEHPLNINLREVGGSIPPISIFTKWGFSSNGRALA